MKILSSIILLCIFVTITMAAITRGTYSDPEYPGKCVINGVLVLFPGEHAQEPSGCNQIYCRANSSVEFHTCGDEPPPVISKVADPIMPQAPYPECCEKL